jgi:hypothetical protein
MGKHKHYDVIVAAAEGKEIQYRTNDISEWTAVKAQNPFSVLSFTDGIAYRIKPEPVYPKSQMGYEDLEREYWLVANEESLGVIWSSLAARNLADAAIKRAIQDGDVILPNKE